MGFLRRHASLILKLAVSAGLCVFLFTRVDVHTLGTLFGEMSLLGFTLACAMMFVAYLMDALAWYLLQGVGGVHLGGYKATVLITLKSRFFALLLPGAVGEDVSKVFYAAKDDPQSRQLSLLTIIWLRIQGLWIISMIVAGAWLVNLVTKSFTLPSEIFLVALSAVVGIGGLVFVARYGTGILTPYVPKVVPQKYQEHVYAVFNNARILANDKRLGLSALSTLSSHVLVYSLCFVLARALGLGLSFGDIIMAMPVAMFLTFIPISLNGLGVREAALVVLLRDRLAGVSPQEATAMLVALSLAFFAVTLVWGAIGGLIVLMNPHGQNLAEKH